MDANDMTLKLDLGCGKSKKEGYIGVDKYAYDGVDIVHDLNTFPYPFKNNEIESVWLDNVLEHMDDPIKVMAEIHRISKKNAKIIVSVPYFRSAYSIMDPTHRWYFGVNWFNYFDPEHSLCKRYKYFDYNFKVKSIEFDREFKKKGIIHSLFVAIAQKKPNTYEFKLSHLYPLNSLTFHLEVV